MSFDSNGSQASQSQTIPLCDFLSAQEDSLFAWDDVGRETSDSWLIPVTTSGLHAHKHKVFHHGSKEYLTPPSPFIQQGPELGDSGSTIVYKVTAPEGYGYRRPLALKVIVCKENSRPPGPESKARDDALKEVMTMTSIRHPHIVAYVASFEDYCIQTREIKKRPRGKAHAMLSQVNQRIKKHVLGIAMYPPAQCNLRTFMDEVFQSPKEADWIVPHLHTYFGCLSQAVAFLHRHNNKIRHKDIKPENIVIDDFGVPMLTDFGLSKHFETGHYSEGPTPKTLKYADPEAQNEQSRDEHGDIFSRGCVFLEMATVLLGKPFKFAEDNLSDDPSASAAGGGASDFKFSESLHRINSYHTTLTTVAHDLVASDPSREPSVKAVIATLPHIYHMMDGVKSRRPSAQLLYPWFRHLYDVHDSPGPCANCEEERRSGRAIPSRSNSRSPTTQRNSAGGGLPGSSQGLVRRSTASAVVVAGFVASPMSSQMSTQVDEEMGEE